MQTPWWPGVQAPAFNPSSLPTVMKLPEKDGSSQSLSVPVENEDGHSVTTRGWSEHWQGDPGSSFIVIKDRYNTLNSLPCENMPSFVHYWVSAVLFLLPGIPFPHLSICQTLILQDPAGRARTPVCPQSARPVSPPWPIPLCCDDLFRVCLPPACASS